ncbi:hypothetical protein EYF80_005624 [Liparis tanakae]|uniref:Uncharacterized protein n=1 Tax=Liparis tanakae TaxID=230148 RepID=A0A4Z2J2R3_9TELE|nr:hypothetical protein EYF80_005624 [Liparis tanakae]
MLSGPVGASAECERPVGPAEVQPLLNQSPLWHCWISRAVSVLAEGEPQSVVVWRLFTAALAYNRGMSLQGRRLNVAASCPKSGQGGGI